MMFIEKSSTNKSIRLLAIVVAAAILFVALASTESPAQAEGGRIAVFGIVVGAPDDGNIDVATRDGVITLVVDRNTKIDTRKDHKKKYKRQNLDKVLVGDSVIGYYTETSNELFANKLTFIDAKTSNKSRHLKHIFGVVVNKSGKKLTIQTNTGEEIEIESPVAPGNDETVQGSLIVAVVEEDEESGHLEATAIRTAEQTVERLSQAISHEISLAQRNLLKIRISDTASAHLTRLYETLDEIQAETQAKTEAALAEYQASYASTLNENLIAPPTILISGKVTGIDSISLIVAAKGNGQTNSLTISNEVEVELLNGEKGTVADVIKGSFVEISATAGDSASSAVALLIKIVPAPETPNGNEGNGNTDDDTITGTIVIVCDLSSCKQKVIVIDNPNGSDSAAGITDDTTVTGEGDELEPGQEVEITLGDDGFSADEIKIVSSPEPSATPTPTGDGAPAPPIEYTLRGVIRSFSGLSVVLDDVYLELNNVLTVDVPMTVGQEIRFKVIIDDEGRWVVVGVEE